MRSMMIAALLAAAPAFAQEPPTTITPSDAPRQATFETSGDIDTYRAYLIQGRDYGLGVHHASDGSTDWILRGPTGTVLWTGNTSGGDDGSEFRAGRSGYFVIQGRHAGNAEAYPVDYTIRLSRDCRKDAKTKCTIKPGVTQGHTLAYGLDQDWVRLTYLAAGRSYCATLTVTTIFAELAIVTGTGTVKMDGGIARSGGGTAKACFKATSETWFVRVWGDADIGGSAYKLELRQG